MQSRRQKLTPICAHLKVLKVEADLAGDLELPVTVSREAFIIAPISNSTALTHGSDYKSSRSSWRAVSLVLSRVRKTRLELQESLFRHRVYLARLQRLRGNMMGFVHLLWFDRDLHYSLAAVAEQAIRLPDVIK